MSKKKTPLTESEILAIIAAELSKANYSVTDQGYGMLEESMSYYLGRPNGTEIDGRSAVVSTDVADAIEWIMPQVMEQFTQVNEIVKFDPVGPQDQRQADIESQFVYDILMKENDGFIIITEIVKDALMQRNGVAKAYYCDKPEYTVEHYTGVPQEALAIMVQMPNVEIMDIAYDPQGLASIKTRTQTKRGKIVIESVPLEEFRVNAQHNSVNLNTARFTAHVTTKHMSDLVEEGYDEKLLEKIPNYHNYRRDYRWSMMHENSTGALVQSADESLHFVQVHECHMLIDIDQDGIAELMKITCAGSTDVPEVILDIEELDAQPWIATTPIIMPHKFQGLSMTDRLKQLQDQKTAVLRNLFDNLYFQNNQRTAVLEGQVNMDDLLVSRPGGIVRVKRIDAIQPIVTPQTSDSAFNMMRYLDEVRAGRSGVQADGNASPVAIGDRVGSNGVDRLLNAKEALVGLIIRTIAETGIKPLMQRIRDLAVLHLDAVQDYEYRGEWVQVAPQSWINKRNTTVKVGTGTGDNDKKLAVLNSIFSAQTAAVAQPGQALVDQSKIFNTLDDICKLSGLNGASRYFIDPSSQEGQTKQQQVAQQSQQQADQQRQVQVAQMQLEAKLADAQVTAANASMKSVDYKAQADLARHQLESYKAESNAKIAELTQQLAQYKTGIDAQGKADEHKLARDKMVVDAALQLTQIEATAKQDENANFQQNKDAI